MAKHEASSDVQPGRERMTREPIHGMLEALLFVSDEPLSLSRIAKVTGESEGGVRAGLEELAEAYRAEERGFQLQETAGGWRLYTHPAFHGQVEQLVLSWDTRQLSQAALEALSVIAYHQPVSRQGVNAVRGVNSEGVIASLAEKGLVREMGRDREGGNAILYGTTKRFLEKFGLRDVSELPPLEQFAPDLSSQEAIRDRLFSDDRQAGLDETDEGVGEADDEGGDGDIPEID